MVLKTLFDKTTFEETIARIEKLTPNTQGLWGKMNVSQMLAHCNTILQIAVGDKKEKQGFLGWIFAPFVMGMALSDKPIQKNGMTMPDFKITDEKSFVEEKQKIIQLITRLNQGGEELVKGNIHPFFGQFKPNEWGISSWKHTDHHLQQFGV